MSHELTEKIAGLASRINNLAVDQTGSNSRALLQLQDELTDLTVLSIKLDLDDQDSLYQNALAAINNSIELINNADKALDNISQVIAKVKSGVDIAGKIIQKIGFTG
jgi:hypothetical protein